MICVILISKGSLNIFFMYKKELFVAAGFYIMPR